MMTRTILFFATFIMGVSCLDAFAVPTVRQLGIGGTTNTEKPVVTTLPALPKNNPDAVRSTKLQASKDAEDTARLPALGTMKTLNSAKIKQPAVSPGAQVANVGILESNFNAMANRIDALEEQSANALTGVAESGTGNYVTGVSVDGDNKLNINKTRVLYAPVFQGNNDTGANAEIWLVK